ncbi:helix-turn-helix domain-containing protein [Streptomyces sp. NPDC005525]|uniref:helix-turn-helix domain-containing protein n=1 Tax=Streptomyces sp. NPDC005525 TaxID=3364720 RepID=UPI0036A9ABF5
MAVTMEAVQAVTEAAWRRAVMFSDLPTTTKAVAVAVALHADYETGRNARPSNGTVAKLAGLKNDETANRHVRTLVKAGWLTSTAVAANYVKVYSLTLPAGVGMTRESEDLYITTKRPLRGSIDRSLKAPLNEAAVRAASKEETRKAARKAAIEEVVKSYGDLASPDYDWDRWVSKPNASLEPPF